MLVIQNAASPSHSYGNVLCGQAWELQLLCSARCTGSTEGCGDHFLANVLFNSSALTSCTTPKHHLQEPLYMQRELPGWLKASLGARVFAL